MGTTARYLRLGENAGKIYSDTHSLAEIDKLVTNLMEDESLLDSEDERTYTKGFLEGLLKGIRELKEKLINERDNQV